MKITVSGVLTRSHSVNVSDATLLLMVLAIVVRFDPLKASIYGLAFLVKGVA